MLRYACLGLLIGSVMVGRADAVSFGVSFNRNSDEVFASHVTAGAVPQTHWNMTTPDNSGAVGDTLTSVADWRGQPVPGLSVTYAANNTWAHGGANPSSGNISLLKGYLDDGGAGSAVNVAGIPYSEYDLYIYGIGDQGVGGVLADYTVNDGGTTYTPTWLRAANLGANEQMTEGAPGVAGHYARISGLTSSSLTITGQDNAGSGRAPLAGFQIVAASDPDEIVPLFQYNFPASYDGSVNDVVDLSSAGNHGTVGQGHPLALSSNVPSVASPGEQSLDLDTTYGHIITAKNVLNNADIATHGGFTMDVWFNPTGNNGGSGFRKIMDAAGVTYLAFEEIGEPELHVSLSDGVLGRYAVGDGLIEDDWNHVGLVFDTTGNTLNDDGSIDGVLTLLLNDEEIELGLQNRSIFGDTLNRPLSIGRHPTANGEHFRGLVYNPTLLLGAHDLFVIPEPSTVMLLALGMLGLAWLSSRRRPV